MKIYGIIIGFSLLAFSCKTTGDSEKSQEELQKELFEILQPKVEMTNSPKGIEVSDSTALSIDSSEVFELSNPKPE